MDRIIKITLCLFIAILVVTIAITGYTSYVSDAYQSTRVSSYSYMCSITTDYPLYNVTLFIPVPADRDGNSPVVSQLSARQIPGIPDTWQTVLFDTGKATLVKVSIPSLDLPAGKGPGNPYTITIAAEIPSEKTIDTKNPVGSGAVYRPVQDILQVTCDSSVTVKGGSPECSTFLTSLYADYSTNPNAVVSIKSSITGRNSWSVFGPKSNEFSSEINLLLHGENHGWATVKGTVQDRIGSYE
jgi:hypothetical protein